MTSISFDETPELLLLSYPKIQQFLYGDIFLLHLTQTTSFGAFCVLFFKNENMFIPIRTFVFCDISTPKNDIKQTKTRRILAGVLLSTFLFFQSELDNLGYERDWQWFVVWESDATLGILYSCFIEFAFECSDP